MKTLLALLLLTTPVFAQSLTPTQVDQYVQLKNDSINTSRSAVQRYDRLFKNVANKIWQDGCVEAQKKIDAWGNQALALFQQSARTEAYLTATYAEIPDLDYTPIVVPCDVTPVLEDGQPTGYVLITEPEEVEEEEEVDETPYVDESIYE